MFLCGAGLVLAGAMAGGRAQPAPAPKLTLAQSNYIEYCAGCHGIQGNSAPARVPRLRGRVGYFLCAPGGRDYLIRLPNVSHAALPDPEDLAELMNFVIFSLGQESTPSGTRPYSGAEVERLRHSPLRSGESLLRVRAALVAGAIKSCNAPESLYDYGGKNAGKPAAS